MMSLPSLHTCYGPTNNAVFFNDYGEPLLPLFPDEIIPLVMASDNPTSDSPTSPAEDSNGR